jgi:hypothetical protein
MKQFWKSEDRAMDRLLRRQVSQQSDPNQTCKQFDPDLANAYIEQNLTTTEREGFQQHLSLCAHCRTATVSLGRLASAEAQSLLSRPGRQIAAEGWRERIGSLAGAMTTPRWAMAAAAVIVLAVSMPVLLSRTGTGNRAEPAGTAVQPVAQPEATLSQAERATPSSTPVSQATAASAPQTAAAPEAGPPSREQSNQLLAKNQSPAELDAQPTSNRSDEKKDKAESVGSTAQSGVAGGDLTAQSERQVGQQQPAPPPPQQQETSSDQLAKVDAEGARRLPEAEKNPAQVSVLKSGRADGDERAGAVAKIRPEDNNKPASPITVPDSAGRRALAQPSASSMRDGRMNASTRSRGTAERKIGKKRFWLRDDVWTDNDYNPEKEMPMVTIVRDSDVFKEVTGKRATLKGYLTGFAETERAIVVYKGTIYKLIPQQDK